MSLREVYESVVRAGECFDNVAYGFVEDYFGLTQTLQDARSVLESALEMLFSDGEVDIYDDSEIEEIVEYVQEHLDLLRTNALLREMSDLEGFYRTEMMS